jgi:uncharacterized Tic20 family protein
VAVIGWATICFGIGALFLLGAIVVSIIFGIIAGLRANEGQLYQYPVSIKMIK